MAHEIVASSSAAPSILTAAEFQRLADIPAENEWFANIQNAHTREAYKRDISAFMRFIGIQRPEDFRSVKKAHVIAWVKVLWPEKKEDRRLSVATVRRHLSALSSLMNYLCSKNAITHNPVDGVARPKEETTKGKTKAISDAKARELLQAPPANTKKGLRDRAILAVLLYQGLRRAELCSLKVSDIYEERGLQMMRITGKGSKIREIPVHPKVGSAVADYLGTAGHREDKEGALFRPVKNSRGRLDRALTPGSIFSQVVFFYGQKVRINVSNFGPHSLRATAATNALEHNSDIAKVQNWLGHSDISTTRLYDKREDRAEDSPTFKVSY